MTLFQLKNFEEVHYASSTKQRMSLHQSVLREIDALTYLLSWHYVLSKTTKYTYRFKKNLAGMK
jgi:hypothetical protein